MIWWAGLDLIGNKFAAYGEIIIWRLLAWSTLDRWVFVGVHVQCLVRSAALHMYAVLNLCGPFARIARPSSYQIIIKLLNCFCLLKLDNWTSFGVRRVNNALRAQEGNEWREWCPDLSSLCRAESMAWQSWHIVTVTICNPSVVMQGVNGSMVG